MTLQAMNGVMEMGTISAMQSVQTAVLRKQLDTSEMQASLLLDTFAKMNENINTDMTRSVKPYLGTQVDLYI
ncbi:MAG: YjfB family protein [Peptococcaceae bacterium]|jgi:hypothetical protein|nr:YjfB family protein [Peptococcaceae bacterium]